jgi:hypothetical protein
MSSRARLAGGWRGCEERRSSPQAEPDAYIGRCGGTIANIEHGRCDL